MLVIKQLILTTILICIALASSTAEIARGSEPKGVLVILNGSNSPIITGLNKHFTTITETDALSRLSTHANNLNKNPNDGSLNYENVIAILTDVAGIGIDGSLLTADSFRSNLWLRAAKQLNKPIISENVDATKMSALTGCGLDSEAVIFQFDKDREVHISIFGTVGASEQRQGILETVSDSALVVPEAGLAITGNSATREVGATVAVTASISPGVLTSQIYTYLHQLDIEKEMDQRVISTRDTSLPRRIAYACIMNYQPIRWDPVSGQEIFIDIDFDIKLYDTTSPENKWVAISTSGPGVSASSSGNMLWNEDTNRGYYMESFEIEFGPKTNGNLLSVDKFAPEAENSEGRYTSTTGLSVKFEGGFSGTKPTGSVGLTYNLSEAQTTFIKDFSVKTFTQERGNWRFNLSKTGEGDLYENWESLKDGDPLGPHIKTLPSLATGETMTPHNEVVWRTTSDYQSTVPIDFLYKQTLRRVWADRSICGLGWCYKSNTQVFTQSKEILIDFSLVNFEGDLSISSQDITFTPTPVPGEFSNISANVQASLANYDNVIVEFYDGNPASSQSRLIASEVIQALDQPSGIAQATWELTSQTGWHEIWVVVKDQAGELSSENNSAWQRVYVTEAGEVIVDKYNVFIPIIIKR